MRELNLPNIEDRPVMLWSENGVKMWHRGNVRPCKGWMNEANARAWCSVHGVRFEKRVERNGVSYPAPDFRGRALQGAVRPC